MRPSIHIDVSTATDTAALHAILASGLGFPAYYGANWDAFWECIQDTADERVTVVFVGMERLKCQLPEDYSTLMTCLREVVREPDPMRITILGVDLS